jgi:hypothetical protein
VENGVRLPLPDSSLAIIFYADARDASLMTLKALNE